MNRDAHVRAARRRQAQDALVFEQEREAMIVSELEDLLAAVEGARLDATLFAQLGDADAEHVRAALGQLEPESYEDDDDDETGVDEEDLVFSPFEFDAVGVAGEDDVEEEIERLQEVLAVSRRAQIALGRYLDLLSAADLQEQRGPAGA